MIGSPLPVVALTVAGAVAAVVGLVRRRRLDGRMLLVGAYILVPLALIIGAHSTLYNSLRQFLFVAPGMIVLAAVLLVRWARESFDSGRTALAWALIGAAVLGQGEALYASARIYPYEYSYFSPLAGGYTTARHDYESTYYGSCTRAAAVWLGRTTSSTPPTRPRRSATSTSGTRWPRWTCRTTSSRSATASRTSGSPRRRPVPATGRSTPWWSRASRCAGSR
ncbi:hypothetical protein ACFQZ4_08315 [Catellatospora coxensis]